MAVDPQRMNALEALMGNQELGGEAVDDVALADMEMMPNPQVPQREEPMAEEDVEEDETVGGLNNEFAKRFKALQKAVRDAGGELMIYSGARTAEHQGKLLQSAIQKFGDEKEAKRRVAEPGKSNHEIEAGRRLGLGTGAVAGDVRGDIALAHKLAPRFGLAFPIKDQAWHIELAGVRDIK